MKPARLLRALTQGLLLSLLLAGPATAALPGLKVTDSGRYFKTTTGQPFFMVGRQINYTWGDFWRLFEMGQTTQVDAYLAGLAGKGINTLRIFAEDLYPGHDYLFETDVTTGALNNQVAGFLRTLLTLGEKHGIYFIISPWETFYMGAGSEWFQRWSSNQYYTKGIIDNPGDFYRVDNPKGLNDAQKRRLSSLVTQVIQGRKNVILELLNEVDGQWQMPYVHRNSQGAPWRATWFPQVVQPWLEQMRDHVRAVGFDGLLAFSTSVEFPSIQAELDFLFRLPGFDFLLYHPYNLDQAACNTWPCNLLHDWPQFATFCGYGVRCTGDPGRCNQPTGGCGAEHPSVQPARDMRNAARFAYLFGSRPYVDGEDGPLFRSAYGSDFSSTQDVETFRNQQWANVASGAATSGIRHPQGVLSVNESLLWSEMDNIQGTIAQFFKRGALVDLNTFEGDSLEDALHVSTQDDAVVKLGVKDREGLSAIAYLLVDPQRAPATDLGALEVSVDGLIPNRTYGVEYWQTSGFRNAPSTTQSVRTDGAGVLRFSHALNASAAFKISLAQPARSTGAALTAQLAVGAVIHTEELGPVDAVWKEGGRTRTARGDVVIWGHFYAPPSLLTWGDANNPDAFAKFWFDASGRVDVNFFHVSVPDITVNSAFADSNGWNASGTITTGSRYLRQEYASAPPSITPTSGSGVRSTSGYQVTSDLNIAATFYPGTAESFPAAWREGGRATTARGDQVIWGYFYADPGDRDWGSAENPDVYAKIWFDASGRVDVNFFHVSVPNIRVDTRFNTQSQGGLVTLDNRYVRHEYRR